MSNRAEVIAWVILAIAFFAPIWAVSLAMTGANKDTQQYGGLQSALMGVYNLVLIIPSLIFLLKGRKQQGSYAISVVLAVCSISAMCLWAFGGSS